MKLSSSQVKKALTISKTIQNYIDKTGDTNLRSTDVFPELVKKKIFEPDRHNGVHFRRFLYKLEKSGELKSLIPQCSQVKPVNGEVFSEWYFHCAKDKMPAHKTATAINGIQIDKLPSLNHTPAITQSNYTPMEMDEALDIIRMLIAGVNPITERFQDNLGVCSDVTVIEALKTIITPEVYNKRIETSSEINTKKPQLNGLEEIKNTPKSIKDRGRYSKKISRLLSATALGNLKAKNYQDVLRFMIAQGYIYDKLTITDKGLTRGLKMKYNTKGEKWIVYPESLAELL